MSEKPNLDDNLVLEYLAECREHLATIETDLLTIEQAGAEIDEQLVNRVFRAAHSIKGGAGFFGLAKIRELAHRTENVLDMIRSRQMVPSPEVVSILLLAFDKLRELIADYRVSEEADISEFVAALTSLATDNLPDSQKGLLSQRVAIAVPVSGTRIEVSAFDLTQARTGGKWIYLIEFDLLHDMQRKGLTPGDVFKKLVKCGTMLETVFDLASAGTLEDEISNRLLLEVLYATVLEPELILQLIDVPADRLRVVEKNGVVRPIDKPSAAQHGEAAALPVAAIVSAPPVVAAAPVMQEAVSEPTVAAPAEAHKAPPAAAAPAPGAAGETTIRLNLKLLDSLMTLAGELVLSRNQLNEAVARQDFRTIRTGAQRVSLVTSELQEVVTATRMQPVGNVLGRYPRLVRDLARDLNKEVQLVIEGGDVELDKSILEGLSDPLTHMVRNAVDHGIESRDARLAAGKPAMGTVRLRAAHEAGQVVIEISDDGKGMKAAKLAETAVARGLISRERADALPEREKLALIMLPGLSTAEKVTDVSGRGVGMDVVKTNLDRLGGKIEIHSEPGHGTSFRIKLPLTLAIIPSLLVSAQGERFAIPQVNVKELIRIPAAQVRQRLDRVGDAEVLILRDRMVPLVELAVALGVAPSAVRERTLNVVVVDTGAFEYGLVVEELHDTVEIVVKPLGRHLQGLRDYAGATVLGDGRLAVILDVAGVAARAGLTAAVAEALNRETAKSAQTSGERRSLLLFHNGPSETCGVPIEMVSRVEKVRAAQIEMLGGRRTMQYRGATLPLVALADVAAVGQLEEMQQLVVIEFAGREHAWGLLAAEPLDMVEANIEIDRITLRQPGVTGSAIIKGRTTLILDVRQLAGEPELEPVQERAVEAGNSSVTVLVADDSDFFRGQVCRLVEAVGYNVLSAEDGEAAWEVLDRHAGEVNLVATDVEMPRLDGLGLTRRIRGDSRFSDLPVIALTSLAGEEDLARGQEAGVSDYQVKLNPDDLLASIRQQLSQVGRVSAAQ